MWLTKRDGKPKKSIDYLDAVPTHFRQLSKHKRIVMNILFQNVFALIVFSSSLEGLQKDAWFSLNSIPNRLRKLSEQISLSQLRCAVR